MTARASASQNSTTSRRRSVHQRSLPYWLAQARVRSITQRLPAWTGAGSPLHLQAEQSVVGGQYGQAMVGDAAVAAAEHQDLNEPVEDDPVGDARTVAAKRVGVVMGGQQRGELDPQRL
jgi:hypothetical protein